MALFTTASAANLLSTKDRYTEIRYVGVILGGLIPVVTKQKRTVTRTVNRYFGIRNSSADDVASGLAGGENVTVTVETESPISSAVVQATESYGTWVDTT